MDIIPGIKGNKVCPYCGNDVFVWQRHVNETVLVNSDFEVIRVLATETLNRAIRKPLCNNCQKEIAGFVTNEFFYVTVCSDEFEDTLVQFVQRDDLHRLISVSKTEFPNGVIKDSQTINIASVVSPLGWLLVIELAYSETTKHYHTTARIVTHAMVTKEHVQSTSHPEVIVKCPPAVAGCYTFEFEGKNYAVYLIEEEYELSSQITYAQAMDLAASQMPVEPEGISIVTEGNTKGNTERYPYPCKWTLLKYAPGSGGVLYDTYQNSDRAKMHQVITDALTEGYAEDDLILMPPSRSVNIDEFLKEGLV